MTRAKKVLEAAENVPDRILKRIGSDMVNRIGRVKIGFGGGDARILDDQKVAFSDEQGFINFFSEVSSEKFFV